MSGPEVKFTADTSGLEAGSKKAVDSINSVRSSTDGLRSYFEGIKSLISDSLGSAGPAGEAASKAISSVGTNAVRSVAGLTALAAAGTAALAVVAAIGAVKFGESFVQSLVESNDHLDELSQRMGLTIQQASQLSAIAQLNGKDINQFAQAQQRLSTTMLQAANGGKQQAAILREIGLTAEDASDPMGAFLKVADKFKDMPDGPQKTALAMRALGPAATDLIPVFNKGSEALKEQVEFAESLGVVVGVDLVAATNRINDTNRETEAGLGALKKALQAELVPAVAVTTESFRDLVLDMVESYKNGGLVKDIVEAIGVTFKVAAVVIASAGLAVTQIFYSIRIAIAAVSAEMSVYSDIVKAAFSGDFQGAADAWNGRLAKVSESTRGFRNDLNAANAAYDAFVEKVMNPPEVKGTQRPTGSGDMALDGLGGDAAAKRAAAAARKAALERLRAQVEEIETRQSLAEDDLDAQLSLEDEKVDLIKGFYGEQSAEYQRALQSRQRMAERLSDEIIRIERDRVSLSESIRLDEISTEQQLNDISIQQRMDAVDQYESELEGRAEEAARRRAILLEEQIQNEITAEQRMYDVRVNSLQSLLEMEGLRVDERRRISSELEEIEIRHQNRMQVIRARGDAMTNRANDDAVNAARQKWMGITQPIAQAFSGVFQSVWNGTDNFKMAFLKQLNQMFLGFVQMGFNMVAQWAAMELAKSGITAAGVATRTATEAAGAATSVAITTATGKSNLLVKAVEAAASAYAAIAAIPVVGPVLAPIAAAGALAAVYALGSKMMSARGGYDIPSGTNPVTQLHAEEMVLPAHIANPLREALRGAGPRGGDLAAGLVAGASRSASGGATGGHGAASASYVYNDHSGRLSPSQIESNTKAFVKGIQKARRSGALAGVKA